MRSLRFAALLLLTILSMGNRGCVSPDTLVAPEGPKAAALGKAKDDQITGLTTQVKTEQEARLMEQALASKAASNLKGVLKAREYLDPSLIKDAIGAEANLGLTRLPPDDPTETVKALERVVLIVTGQRDAAEQRYQLARNETAAERAAKDAKDHQIAGLTDKIKVLDGDVIRLKQEADIEKQASKDKLTQFVTDKNAEIKRINDENASKEKRWWTNAVRIVGLGFVVIGAILIIAFKILPEGIGSIIVGLIIGLAAIGLDILVSQWWFPWACGILGLLIVGGGSYALYRMWKKHTLQTKVTAALQDLKDESTTLKNGMWDQVQQHLDYRLGDKGQVELTKLAASLNLVNPKAESIAVLPTQS